ncbi:hypothetical protein, partial [Curtobacterium oceanosedimentum]|uniref:hypothetical protein n=1 Tax=Curtobacterium oceanosedimentum TaxID=465820 RepID=UPI003390A6DD
ITLPAGPYQLWANQRTKGGKIEFTGINVHVSKPAAPSVEGYFLDDVSAWAHIKGEGITAGATVTVKQGQTVIASGPATGSTFDLAIDPSKVGYGQQQFTVTQTINGVESDGAAVTLDYGQNTVQFENPTEGQTIAGNPLSFTGSGNAGGIVQVNGTDFTQDTAIGSSTVTNGKWTITNSAITLPAGPYQLWANQRTKGGKIEFTAVNVQVG